MMRSFRRFNRMLRTDFVLYLRTSGKKSLIRQFREIYSLYRLYDYLPYQYLKHGLYLRKFGPEIDNYLPTELLHMTRDAANGRADLRNVEDKLIFEKTISAADLLSTKTLFRIERGHIADMAGNPLTYTEFVTALDLERLPDGIIIKPMTGGSGSAVFKLHIVEGKLTHKGERLDQLRFEYLIFSTNNGGYWTEFAVQETISQHPDIAYFNPTSVNTVRIDTFVDAEGMVQCNAAALKVGTRGSIVDNSSAGGFMISINLETGQLMSGAKQEAQFGGQYHDLRDAFEIDPETFVIPFWPQTREAVTKAAKALAPLRSLGWDVAITPIGPLIIEANADYGIDVLQELAGGYRGKPLGQAYLRQTR